MTAHHALPIAPFDVTECEAIKGPCEDCGELVAYLWFGNVCFIAELDARTMHNCRQPESDLFA